ncbi:ketosteroid isomerase-like protein [Sphingopyxis panaciterrae]|uniref:nuclear transport factor 2 family protein n=1 Tax=Sphingopyxis panaciterrae TaxID=363841 RepID=UPI001422FA9F|nr:nuclear transport factor 2 family protein [Sphingopyxis panaciterrae]NIJ37487.1 ketosteroid isomerase-like protein [Sphingopyxis panaciterrae]
MNQSIQKAIEELEKRRVAALIAADTDTLGELLTEDLVHVHGTGQIDGKAAYLDGVKSKYRFLEIERGDLHIRDYGHVVVVVGSLAQTVNPVGTDSQISVSAIVTQTWVRVDDGWKQSTCHTGFLAKI